LNRFGLPENLVAAELVAKRLAALILLKWDLVSGAVVVSVVVFAVNVVVEFVLHETTDQRGQTITHRCSHWFVSLVYLYK
jgi:hypothetical protein